MRILAIDPGNVESAYCVIDTETYRPEFFAKVDNKYLKSWIRTHDTMFDKVIVEMVASYGMPVGESVFQTCVWIGRFIQLADELGKDFAHIYRKDEKMNICHSMKAKDSNIRQALIDRFGPVGTKNNKRVVLWF